MLKLVRMAAFALPLGLGGVVMAQGTGTSGSAGAPGTAGEQTVPSKEYQKRVREMRKPGRQDVAPYGTMRANPSQTGVQPEARPAQPPQTPPANDESMTPAEQQQLRQNQLDSDK